MASKSNTKTHNINLINVDLVKKEIFSLNENMKIEDGKNTEQRSEGKGEVCSRTDSKRKQSKSGVRKPNGKV